MKIILFLLLYFLISFNPNLNVQAQWKMVNGPYGGDVVSLASQGSNVYAGTNGAGIYKSSDHGKTWISSNNGLTSPFITSLIVYNSKIFALTAGQGIYLSTDSGQSWSRFVLFSSSYYLPTSLSISGSTILVTSQGVNYTFDHGKHWFSPVNGLTHTDLKQSSAIVGGMFLIGRYGEGIYKTLNPAQNWVSSNNGLGNLFINALIKEGNIIYACTEGGIFKSTDVGQNWESINSGLTDLKIKSLSISGANFFAGTGNGGVFQSTNYGQTWYQTTLANKFIKSILAMGMNVYAGSHGEGLFRSIDNGQNWISIDNFGFKAGTSYITGKKNYIYCATSGCGIYRSSDYGKTWKECNSGLTNLVVQKIVSNENYMFAGTSGHGIFRSSDDGLNWIPVNNGRNNFTISDLYCDEDQLISCTNDLNFFNQVLLSADYGQSWQNVWPQITFSDFSIQAVFTKENDMYVGGRFKNYGGLYKSTNNGQNWIRVLNNFILHLKYQDSILFAGTTGGIYISSNNGNNWTSINNGLPQFGNVNFILKDQQEMYSSVFYGYGIYRSANNGLNWSSFNEGFNSNQLTTSLLSTDKFLFTTTENNGLWKRPIIITSLISNQNITTSSYQLFQNYPNPFNPATKIVYSIIKNNFISLKVYDFLGKHITTLVNQNQTPGTYEVQFDGSDLSSGVYYYKLETENFSEVKKMILLK